MYVGLWAFLLAALFGSLALGPLAGSSTVVALIFGIATIKAVAVVGWYMHLLNEARFIKFLMVGTGSLMAILFVGLVPDIVWVYGLIPEAEANHGVVVEAMPVPAPAHAPSAADGRQVYDTHCVACHQADGTGMNGKLAANFVEDRSRLAKSDDELLIAINRGTRGDIGVMPPWGQLLDTQQHHDVLAYLRETYGEPR